MIDEKCTFVEAVYVEKAQTEKDSAFLLAKDLAVGERDIHGRKIGARFNPTD